MGVPARIVWGGNGSSFPSFKKHTLSLAWSHCKKCRVGTTHVRVLFVCPRKWHGVTRVDYQHAPQHATSGYIDARTCCLSMRQAVILTHVGVVSARDKRLYRRTYVLPQHATSGYIDARTCCLSML